ncbi:MAG: Rieske (2Fe-2S) protein [bacterium]
MTRREILQLSIAAIGILPAFPILGCNPTTSANNEKVNENPNLIHLDLTTSSYAELSSVGGSVYAVIQSQNLSLIVTRVSGTEIDAVSSVCTHAGCEVGLLETSLGGMRCACHNSMFRPDGSVIGGPASRPLQKYPVTFDGETTVTIDIS